MKQQKILFILVLLALVVVGILLLSSKFHTPAQVTTSTPSVIPISCIKTQLNRNENIYRCSAYSIKLSSGWMENGSEHAEFMNYDPDKAPGRSYDPTLDKGKLKFGITVYNTTYDLRTIATRQAKLLEQKIISITPLTINNYPAIKVYSKHPLGYNVNTYYIQDLSKTLVAETSPIFGYDNTSDFENQILSTFTFVK